MITIIFSFYNIFQIDSIDYRFQWNSPGYGQITAMMLIMGTLAMSIVLLIDFEIFSQWILDLRELGQKYYHILESGQADEIDEEVKEEIARVRMMGKNELESYQLVAKDLSKYYGKLLAVNQLCIAVEK